MKIGKKILACTLALMNSLPCIHAEKYENQKAYQNSVQSSSLGIAKTLAVMGVVAGGLSYLGCRLCKYVSDRNEKINKTKRNVIKILVEISLWYCSPDIRDRVEAYTGDLKELKSLKYLFRVLDGVESSDDVRVKEALESLCDYYYGKSRQSNAHKLSEEVSNMIYSVYSFFAIYSDALTVNVSYLLDHGSGFPYACISHPQDRFCVMLSRGAADFPCSLDDFKVIEDKTNKGVHYNLSAIICKYSYDLYPTIYMKCGEKWYMCSVFSGRVEVSQETIDNLCKELKGNVDLIYSR